MDLGDMLKMDEAMTKRRLYRDAMDAKAGKTPAPAPVEDAGVVFKFGNNNQKD